MLGLPHLNDLVLGAFSTLATAPANGAAPNGFTANSIWDLILKGGWIMIPLGLCSLMAMAIAVERLILARRARVAPPALVAAIPELAADPQRGLDRLAADPSPLAAVLTTAIKSRDESRETRDRLIDEAGQRQVLKLRQRMRVMGSLPQVATMLGLLGTVFGMIRTFTVVAASGESLGKTEKLAQGIYEAWTATAAGLAVAIPTLIAFHFILGRIDAAAAALDQASSDWMERAASKPATAAAPIARVESPIEAQSDKSLNGVAAVGV
jgi:biopolymer transport protein ExbB